MTDDGEETWQSLGGAARSEFYYRRYRRHSLARRYFGGVEHPAVNHFVETGEVRLNGWVETAGDIVRQLVEIADLCGGEEAARIDPLSRINASLARDYADWCAARAEKRRQAWEAGFDCLEVVDPETGEVQQVWAERDRSRQPPVVDGKGDEVPYPGFQPGGLAFRARATRPRPEGDH